MKKRKKGLRAARNRQLDDAAKRLKDDASAFALAGVHGRRLQVVDQAGDILESVMRILEMRKVDIDDVKESYLRRQRERDERAGVPKGAAA